MPRLNLIILITLVFITNASADTSYLQNAVNYLASSSLEGRKSGANGNLLAVQFAKDELAKNGLLPLDNFYTEDFTIFTGMEKDGDNILSMNNSSPMQEFQPISFSQSGDIKNSELVFLGFGISIPKNDEKLKYDDYEGIDVTGKTVVVFAGDPGIGNPKSLFRDPDYISYRSTYYKLKNAITHGALGIIIIQDPLSLETYPNENAPRFNESEGGGERFNILAGYMTNKWLNSLLQNADSIAIQKQIANTQLPFSFTLNTSVNLSVHLKKKTGRVSNIIGVIPGTDEKLKKEVVVIGGHIDHLGYGGESSLDNSTTLDPKQKLKNLIAKYQIALRQNFAGKIHPGADDNASGTAMVLKLAKELSNKKLKRTHLFILFNAEEIGLLGSQSFLETWSMHQEKWGNIVSMLNYDMIGRYSHELSLMGVDSGLEWKNILNPITVDLNLIKKDTAIGSSDHASFLNKKIPSLFFTTGAHPDYHTSRDTADKINFNAMESIESYSMALIDGMENSTLTFNTNYQDGSNDSRPRGYGAHLGCVPEFGQPDTIKGVVCMKTSTGSPAEKAGILPNDVLIQIGDVDVKSVYDLAFALKYYRPGDQIEIKWTREGVIMKAIIVLMKSTRG